MPPSNTLLPVPNRTIPFWLCEVDPLLQRHRTTAELPTSPVDVVVIGSGLSGNLTAYHLLKKDPSLKVVMVEADDWCSGATARNGGHCKPMTYFGYEEERKMRGARTANDMLVFEESHLARYAALVEAEDIDCDLHVTRACDVFFDEAEAQAGQSAFRARKRDFPQSVAAGDLREISDPRELERISGMKGGFWGITYPAGHLWPYKLAAGRESARMCFLSRSTPPLTGGSLHQSLRSTSRQD
jgi:glycine/D-amino acid oxidase-like deaminating enzyme